MSRDDFNAGVSKLEQDIVEQQCALEAQCQRHALFINAHSMATVASWMWLGASLRFPRRIGVFSVSSVLSVLACQLVDVESHEKKQAHFAKNAMSYSNLRSGVRWLSIHAANAQRITDEHVFKYNDYLAQKMKLDKRVVY